MKTSGCRDGAKEPRNVFKNCPTREGSQDCPGRCVNWMNAAQQCVTSALGVTGPVFIVWYTRECQARFKKMETCTGLHRDIFQLLIQGLPFLAKGTGWRGSVGLTSGQEGLEAPPGWCGGSTDRLPPDCQVSQWLAAGGWVWWAWACWEDKGQHMAVAQVLFRQIPNSMVLEWKNKKRETGCTPGAHREAKGTTRDRHATSMREPCWLARRWLGRPTVRLTGTGNGSGWIRSAAAKTWPEVRSSKVGTPAEAYASSTQRVVYRPP